MANKFNKADQADSQSFIRTALDRATHDSMGRPVIYTVLRSVSRSGMMRKISPFTVDRESGELISLAWHYDRAHGRMADDSCGMWANKVGGCGMDMGFALASNLAYVGGRHDCNGVSHRWA